MTKPFFERIAAAAIEKKSPIVLALDTRPQDNQRLPELASKIIDTVQRHICAIKMNFHIILPLSASEIFQINKLAHSFGLQSIADIKLNDIETTNDIAVEQLIKMGFDAIIANPFIGKNALASLVQKAHKKDAGIIALVYMSHPEAREGFGLKIHGRGLYKTFFERAETANADGIIVGATQDEILKEVGGRLPIYSPGVGAQGGDPERVIRNGADYLIIGRSIIEAKQPVEVAREMQDRISFSIGK
ncbi:MAG: orotidine-5'-phosphate decarboxylase [Thermoproteota archaeon]|nr:orotidine-5'-phosphate decarboxylase [Thermoproteota archaeon]